MADGEVTVRGRVLKRGRRVSFAEGHAYGPDGTLLGHGTTSLAVIGR
jgi:acyl-coenzyme A thioesterase PaaI-like protein